MTEQIEHPPFEVCLIDADSMIYNICWFEKSIVGAQSTMMDTIHNISVKSGAPDIYVFVKGNDNFRFKADPEYKGNRKVDPEDLLYQRVQKLYEYAREEFVNSDGGEADDYCAIYANSTLEEGRCPVVAHVDKDLNTIPGWHMSLNKKDNGRVYFVTPEEAYLFMMQQLLAGDSTDNIKGIPGMGLVKACRVVEHNKYSDMLEMVHDTYKEKVGRSWKKEFVKTANCTMLRTSLADLRPLTFEELNERLKWYGDEESMYIPGRMNPLTKLAQMDKPTVEGQTRIVYEADDDGTIKKKD